MDEVKRIAIVHFAPMEQYPPIMNLAKMLEGEYQGLVIRLYTTHSSLLLAKYEPSADWISIRRQGKSGKDLGKVLRYWNYLKFYTGVFISLLLFRPGIIMYYETMSVFPVYLYRRYFRKKAKLYIHYHEYTSQEELRGSSGLFRYFHSLEMGIYEAATWVSHTNEGRLERFLGDIEPNVVRNPKVLPNYPLRNWRLPPKQAISKPVRMVYVGALGLETMYIREFAFWVLSQKGDVLWDIYSINSDPSAMKFLESLKSEWVSYRGGVEYYDLPKVLRNYDIGVILYKGHIDNYVWNAPNKLFEYLVCGLDVWFPRQMKGAAYLVGDEETPKVLAHDFNNLKDLDLSLLIRRTAVRRKLDFVCEDALYPLIQSWVEA